MALSSGQLLSIHVQTGCANIIKSQIICSSFVISEGINTERDSSELESYEFKFKQLLSGFPRRKNCRVRFTVHPRLPIFVSSCEEQNLTATNYSTK